MDIKICGSISKLKVKPCEIMGYFMIFSFPKKVFFFLWTLKWLSNCEIKIYVRGDNVYIKAVLIIPQTTLAPFRLHTKFHI